MNYELTILVGVRGQQFRLSMVKKLPYTTREIKQDTDSIINTTLSRL